MYTRLFQQPDLGKVIRGVFYNMLVKNIIDKADVTEENIAQKIMSEITSIILGLLENSKNCEGIQIAANIFITLDNCPEEYQTLFNLLLSLKNGPLSPLELDQLAHHVMQLDSFAAINPTQFLSEALGFADPNKNGITPDLIRGSFYNEMVTQALLAIQNGWLTYENLADQDSQIYLILPAMTILEAIRESAHCDGIKLLDEKILTNENCPQSENFPIFTKCILGVKQYIKSLSNEELDLVKQIIACGNKKDITIKQKNLMNSVAEINRLAIDIGSSGFFCKMIESVLELCCETLKPQAHEDKSNYGYKF